MITAKELAKKLGLSQTAVSMALNNKKGVSEETRRKVIAAAEQYGYDFSRLNERDSRPAEICYISYRIHNAIMGYTPIETEMIEGMEQECRTLGFHLKTMSLYKNDADKIERIEDLLVTNCAGIIVAGTEMHEEDIDFIQSFSIPTVMLDCDYVTQNCVSVTIDNVRGAYMAADYLMKRYDCNPGYLASTYPIENFRQRRKGFEEAVKACGKSIYSCLRYELTPSVEGAMNDMIGIIEDGGQMARAYFAEDDFIAIGALKAFRAKGLRVPEDVAIIGFDNVREDKICEPALTTINVPFHFMGRMAVRSFDMSVREKFPYPYKITIGTSLVERGSV